MNATIKKEDIKKHLRKGDLKQIAEQFGFTQSYISQVLRGLRSNYEVMTAIILKAEENKEIKDQLLIRTKKL